jgi:hypothetical protein
MHLNGVGHVDAMAGFEDGALGVLVLQVGFRCSLDLVVHDLGFTAQVADGWDLFSMAANYGGVPIVSMPQKIPQGSQTMPKSFRPLPDRSEITDDTPLHLDTAARLAFPDGVVSGLALRNAAARGDLEYERLGGRIVTTLRWIGEWRERNRYPARARREIPNPDTADGRDTTLAMLAARQTLLKLRNLPKNGKSLGDGKKPKGQR